MSRFGRRGLTRLSAIVKPVFRAPVGKPILALLACLLGLLIAVNTLNVAASYVGRGFMTSLAERQTSRFFLLAALYAGMFGLTTCVSVIYRFTEERLGLLWRAWMTEEFIRRYLSGHTYLRLRDAAQPDNPDQRISEDVRTFTTTTLSLLLIVSNSMISLFSFSGVLWSITPWLLAAALLCAALGTVASLLVGRRLAGLNFEQLRREADLRYGLVRIREYADEIALLKGERDEQPQLGARLARVVDNLKAIIAVNRNLGFFTTGYGYLNQIIPVLVTAPLFLRGEVDFGAVAQATVAFGFVLGAFSLVVNEFQRLATIKAVVDRLGELWEAFESEPPGDGIEIYETPGQVAWEHLTIDAAGGSGVLIRDLCLEIAAGTRVLIQGTNGAGRTALVRATAGLPTRGTGTIRRPPPGDIQFLPERSFLTESSLRDQLFYGISPVGAGDARIGDVLHAVRLDRVLERVGSIDAVRDWPHVLSQGEQQALAIARLLLARPEFVILDGSISALDAKTTRDVFNLLRRAGITYITVSNDPGLVDEHDLVLELHRDGSWIARPEAGHPPHAAPG